MKVTEGLVGLADRVEIASQAATGEDARGGERRATIRVAVPHVDHLAGRQLRALAALAARQYERSVLLLAAATTYHNLAGTVRSPGEQAAYDRCADATSSALGAGAYRKAWDRGRALPLEDAVGLVLAVDP